MYRHITLYIYIDIVMDERTRVPICLAIGAHKRALPQALLLKESKFSVLDKLIDAWFEPKPHAWFEHPHTYNIHILIQIYRCRR